MKQYRALYRDNRPEVFSEILGQEHIVRILKHQIETDTVSHAYLFCGTRGTGKTTTARILAKAVNCTGEGDHPCGECANCRAIAEGHFMDVIEIDAASNNGVENIRELRESVNYPPSVGRKKVYIIDEVHMLSTGAFNALLKTLEEPPENVMFILATTNPEKMPQTVLSRCLRLDFRRVSAQEISENMRRICADHGVEVTDSALALLSGNADGSVRDSLSILEQCMSSGEKVLDRDLVLEFLGTVSEEFYLDLTEKVLTRNISKALLLLEDSLREGKDVKQMMKDWMAHYRSLLIAKFVANPEDMLNMSSENIEKLKEQAAKIELSELNSSIVTLARTINDARYSTQARILMEVAIVTIASRLEYGAEAGGQSGAPRSGGGAPARPQAPARPMAPARPVAQAQAAPVPPIQAAPQQAAPAQAQPAQAVAPARPVAPAQAQASVQAAPQKPAPAMPGEPDWSDVPLPDMAMEDLDVEMDLGGMDPQSMAQARPAVQAQAAPVPPVQAAPQAGQAAGYPMESNPFGGQVAPQQATASSAADYEMPATTTGMDFDAVELDGLWNDIFEEAEPISSTTNYMRQATLVEIGARQFKVIVGSPFAKVMLEKEADLINQLMTKRMGRDLAMVLRDEGESQQAANASAEQIAQQASSVLGINVTVE